MKDIIRQAVADAAEWLYLERGVNQASLINADELSIVETAGEIRLREQADKRKEQLADFVSNPVQGAETAAVADRLRDEDLWSLRRPVIDSVLIAGPEGEIARTGGFVGRCHTVKLRQDGSLSNDSMSVQVGRLDFDFGLQERCADHALALWLRDGFGGWCLRAESIENILMMPLDKSGRDFNKEVLLPAPKDPTWSVPVTVTYDGAEGEGRVWLSTQEDDEPMIAIEGRENAATLASMLIDWVQPDVVVVPRALMEALRDKVDLCSGQELTGEEMETIKALTDLL